MSGEKKLYSQKEMAEELSVPVYKVHRAIHLLNIPKEETIKPRGGKKHVFPWYSIESFLKVKQYLEEIGICKNLYSKTKVRQLANISMPSLNFLIEKGEVSPAKIRETDGKTYYYFSQETINYIKNSKRRYGIKNNDEYKDLYNLRQIADILGMTYKGAYYLVKRKQVPVAKTINCGKNRIRFYSREVLEILARKDLYSIQQIADILRKNCQEVRSLLDENQISAAYISNDESHFYTKLAVKKLKKTIFEQAAMQKKESNEKVPGHEKGSETYYRLRGLANMFGMTDSNMYHILNFNNIYPDAFIISKNERLDYFGDAAIKELEDLGYKPVNF